MSELVLYDPSRPLPAPSDDARGPIRIGFLVIMMFFGGLGGGRSGVPDSFGPQEDYLLGVSWRVGPGGLFDFTRTRSAESRLRQAELSEEKLRDELTREVVEAFTHWQSLEDQLATARRALAAAEEALRLAQERKEFAVGIVLETIQAEQDLTRARLVSFKRERAQASCRRISTCSSNSISSARSTRTRSRTTTFCRFQSARRQGAPARANRADLEQQQADVDKQVQPLRRRR